jgi:hypothetical protein
VVNLSRDIIAHPEESLSFYMHTVRSRNGVEGEVLCGKIGIIEPITYAMQLGFYELPEEMLKICQLAVGEGNIFLGHRLINATKTMIGVTKKSSAQTAKQALRLLKDVHSS